MRALQGLRGPRAPSLPLLLLCFLAALRRSLEHGLSTGVMVAGPRSGLRARRDREAEVPGCWRPRAGATAASAYWPRVGYRNLPGDSGAPRDGDVAAPFTSLPVQEEMMTKSSNLSLESHSISMTVLSSAHSLVGETHQYLIQLKPVRPLDFGLPPVCRDLNVDIGCRVGSSS
ncbi:hypothetical protein E5288_WYG008625 [Bos mutus]|uniref:Uncharacterized protein n=1 Tax=Bos mutus TaxID=72004 RepID=A0A6B0S3T6_9CETA|nr:hypothetical protein [Bos mutus]